MSPVEHESNSNDTTPGTQQSPTSPILDPDRDPVTGRYWDGNDWGDGLDDPDGRRDPPEPAAQTPWAIAAREWLYKAMLEAEAERVERERKQRLRALAGPPIQRRTYPLPPGQDRGSSAPLSVRLPRWLEVQFRAELEQHGAGPSDGLRQIIEEWWVVRRYPALEFRGTDFLRLASIRGGGSVVDWVAAYPRPALPEQVQDQVLDYVELFRARIDAELKRRTA